MLLHTKESSSAEKTVAQITQAMYQHQHFDEKASFQLKILVPTRLIRRIITIIDTACEGSSVLEPIAEKSNGDLCESHVELNVLAHGEKSR